ncbi:unnamed protein product [Owenia fusiformis]|uniref:Uncharacterized protein n=1 Tax=Owenia fusiformis TaxID=6347 RepID=A0A8J1XPX0_OWEFU|nr:unnamed protein product [Owenia fusiformis]
METNNGPSSVRGSPSRPVSKPASNKIESPKTANSIRRSPQQQDIPKTAQQAPSRASLEVPKTAQLTPQQEVPKDAQLTPSRTLSQIPNSAQKSQTPKPTPSAKLAPSRTGSHVPNTAQKSSQALRQTPQLGTPVPQTASNIPRTAVSQIPRTAQQTLGSPSARNASQPRIDSQSKRVETGNKPLPSGYQASKGGSQVPGASQVPPGSRLNTLRTQSQAPKTVSHMPRTVSQIPTGSKVATGTNQVPRTTRTQAPNTGTKVGSRPSQRQSNHTGTNRTKTQGQTSQEEEEEEEEEYEGEYYNEEEDFGEYGYDGDNEEDTERAAIVEPLDYNGCDCFPRLSRPGGHSMVYDQLRCEHNNLTGYQHKGAIRFQDNWDDAVAQSVRKKKFPERPPRKRTILGYPPTELSFPVKGERRVNYIGNPDDEEYEYEDEEHEENEYGEYDEDHGTIVNTAQSRTRNTRHGNTRGQTQPASYRSETKQKTGEIEPLSTAARQTRAKTGQSLEQQQIEEDIDNILPPIGIQKPHSRETSRSYQSQHSLPVISPNGSGRMTAIEEQSETSSRATAGYDMYSDSRSNTMQNGETGSRVSVAQSMVIPERQPFQGKAYDPVTKQVYNYYVDTTGKNRQYDRTLDI